LRPPFALGSHRIAAGERKTVNLPVSVLADHTPVTLSVHAVCGRREGPTLFVSAAIHGDEVIGVEIARRLLRTPALRVLRGTLLVIPIVNTFGFLNRSRYLPDRRDLNRTFPGSERGSLASRLAHLFMSEVVERSDMGIDLHSAAVHRVNLPQVRVSANNDELIEFAKCFGAPVIMTAALREGSLRHAALTKDVGVLVYEAGEGLRFDEVAVRAGVAGILRVMHRLGMIPERYAPKRKVPSILSASSFWVRAPAGGLLRSFRAIGSQVEAGESLGAIADPFGEAETNVLASRAGIVVGRTNLPVVNEGDGLFHIAESSRQGLGTAVDAIVSQLETDPILDEDEII
jgi:predicted deacylase